jgi:hypothetical protein
MMQNQSEFPFTEVRLGRAGLAGSGERLILPWMRDSGQHAYPPSVTG